MKKVIVTLEVTVEVPDHIEPDDVIICSPTHFWLQSDEMKEHPVLESDQISEEED